MALSHGQSAPGDFAFSSEQHRLVAPAAGDLSPMKQSEGSFYKDPRASFDGDSANDYRLARAESKPDRREIGIAFGENRVKVQAAADEQGSALAFDKLNADFQKRKLDFLSNIGSAAVTHPVPEAKVFDPENSVMGNESVFAKMEKKTLVNNFLRDQKENVNMNIRNNIGGENMLREDFDSTKKGFYSYQD